MTSKRYIHRVRNRIGGRITQRTPGAEYVGYFERSGYDGVDYWHWVWATYANQDRKAQQWVCSELHRLDEQIAA